jgi:hypothetical protein
LLAEAILKVKWNNPDVAKKNNNRAEEITAGVASVLWDI